MTAPPDVAAFAAAVADDAAVWDNDGSVPAEVLRAMGGAGLLGIDVPRRHGGLGGDPLALGKACAVLGGVCSSLRSLLTVQTMVAAALARWGSTDQRDRWLPALLGGRTRAAFAATEHGAGSDLAAVETTVEHHSGHVTVRGHKLWVTSGRVADVFLVLGRSAAGPVAVLVEGDRPGVQREPVTGQLGLRAAELAHVRFDVRVPRGNVIATDGFGLTHVVGTALDHGRFTVAWGCAGLARSCVEQAAAHAVDRTQGGVALADHQLVRALLARSLVDTTAAEALCERAAEARRSAASTAIADTVVAKYAAAKAAAAVSRDALQVLGASGCARDSLVGRLFRDAKVMQIIEGSDEVAELHIADHALRRHAGRRVAAARLGGRR
jgi:methoxymalonate biosynthesis protein